MSDEEKLRQYLRKATRDLRRASERVNELEASAREPIAIVGMSCRYPGGAQSPELLWELVDSQTDAVGDFPTNRGWDLDRLYDPDPDRPGTVSTRRGGFLHEAGDFDADFFRLSPREALAMDPQQRLMLELAWEACEDAGIAPPTLHGTPTGVFAGVIHDGYGYGAALDSMPAGTEAYLYGGTASSVFCGRVAYGFGFQGPAIAVDTACSSSLVALHLACQALRHGDCTLALAGGVTVMSTTALLESFSRQRALSPDGRCKAFAACADGAGFSEGAGLVMLERLSDAQRNGHKVLAVIRGSAVNQDGASNGLTAPNGPSQERVIESALASAGLSGTDVDVVEAHGTGTPLGDPIEAHALLATYGQGRSSGPVLLGSAKSNIGHTSAAAGIAGVIKMVLAMRHERLPASLHIDAPSPHVDWTMGEAQLLSEPAEWPRGERPRRAGVSSFGASGTNAHLVLEEPPLSELEPTAPVPVPELGPLPFVLSARTPAALKAQAERLSEWLRDHPELTQPDIAISLACSRAQMEERAAVVATSRENLLEGLDALIAEQPSSAVVSGRAGTGKTVFVFPGQGAQWVGMAAGLLDSSPVFAAAIEECAQAFSPHVEWSLEEVLRGGEGLERVDVVQPALFAVMVALAALWRSRGVEPAMVVGHSQGEIAAAYVAGGLTLEDAARVVTLRSQAVAEELAGRGGMVSVAASAEQLEERIERWGGRVSVAARNAPGMTVLSGEPQALDELMAECEREGIDARRIAVDYASHSEQVQAIEGRLQEVLAPIVPQDGSIAFFSTVTGGLLETSELDAGYWYRSLRESVQFEGATDELIAAGAEVFIEVSPHPVLTVAVQATIDSRPEAEGVVSLGSLRRDQGGLERFLTSLVEAQVHGVEIDWPTLFDGSGARVVELPTYAFQRERYWLESSTGAGDVTAVGLAGAEHPLLGAALSVAGGDEVIYTAGLSLAKTAWLADHVVLDTVIVPAAAWAELALWAGAQTGCEVVEELAFEAPLTLSGERSVALQISVAAVDENGRRALTIHSRPQQDAAAEEEEWTRHANGVLASAEDEDGDSQLHELAAEAWPPEDAERVELSSFYDHLLELGFAYGPAFQGVTAAWTRGAEVFAEISLDEAQAGEATRWGAHPALLDASLHGLCLLELDEGPARGEVQLPFAWSGIRLLGEGGAGAFRVRLATESDGSQSLLALDEKGRPALEVRRLAGRPAQAAQIAAARPAEGWDSLFELGWVPLDSFDTGGESGPVASIGALELPWATDRYEDLAALSTAIAAGSPAPEVVLAALPGAETEAESDGAARAHGRAQATLELLQQWLAQEPPPAPRLVLVASGAIALSPGESPDPAAAAAVGLVRSAQSEHPGQFLVIDVDDLARLDPESLASEEPLLALRDGRLLSPRLRPVPQAQASEPALGGDGTVLVTGAGGGLGGLLARHLVTAHDVERLLLVSRRGASADGMAQLVEELRESGCEVEIRACDVADRDELAAVLASISGEHPLKAVIHAAGVLEDGVIETLTAEQLERVMRPKVDGARNLHELTAGLELEQFVLFSSAVTLFGAAGQGNYAAANGYLDALAQRRRAQGLPATSLAWGLWRTTGTMTGELEGARAARISRLGMLALEDAHGLSLLDRALDSQAALLAPVRLERSALLAQARVGALPTLLSGLVRAPARRRGSAGGDLARRLAETPESEWEALVTELVGAQVATLLGHDSASAIDPKITFKDLGFDSLAGVELRNRLAQITGLRLPATLIFDHPTVAAVAGLLLSRVEQTDAGPATRARRVRRASEPIAIVGMGCRYPGGAHSPQELWELLAAGTDAISPFPEDRGWDLERLFDPDPDHLGSSYAREGGFLKEAGDFDAGFFGISPREAIAMDPQQRLMLEVAWEAIEDARIDPLSLRGSETSVFVGASASSYLGADPGRHEGLALTGTTTSVVSGRLAYVLGLEGSAVTIDTACSSSLVALHLACQALRGGECAMALAGGVTVQATPGMYIEFSRQRGLSPDGRCKSFGAGADGTIWSEGAGVLLLESLADARRNGHRVHAVIRGSATNQDGASNGLTAPHGPSQERVILQALANAELSPGDVDVVEAHGTGTTLGDPIEAQALLATYGRERTDGPLRLGSIKSNIGHGIASAGVAGVIKMVLAMRHGMLPRTLHAEDPSPHVDWDSGELRLLTLPELWVEGERPRRAAVSSFGVSGTNAHLILEAPAAAEDYSIPPELSDAGHPAELPILISGAGPEALRAQAARLGSHLRANPELRTADVALSLAGTRAQLSRRAAVFGSDRGRLIEALEQLAGGKLGSDAIEASVTPGRTAFLFSGQGAQRAGMGRELYRAFPVFAEAVDECCAALDPQLERPLADVLFAAEGTPEATLLDRTEFTQTALFTLEVALARLIGSLGVQPDALIGHSVGEIVAAHVAGVLSLSDACTLIAARGRLMAALPEGGAMLAIEASEVEVAGTVMEHPLVALAAVNGPRAIVLSGDRDSIEQLEELWTDRERKTTRLRVSHAFHSPLIEGMLEDFAEVADTLDFHAPTLTIVSGATGAPAGPEIASVDYWVRQVREPVRFGDGVKALEQAGVTRFLELGPGGVLTALAGESLSEARLESAVLAPTLRTGRAECDSLVRMLADAHLHGANVYWRALPAAQDAREVDLPTYAFQHERYWQPHQPGSAGLAHAGLDDLDHPLLSSAVKLGGTDGWLLTGRLSLATHPWLADHAMLDTVLLAGTGFLELAFAAGRICGCEAVEELTLEAPLVLPPDRAVRVQLGVESPDAAGMRGFTVHACVEPAEGEPQEWTRCASGTLAPTSELEAPDWPDAEAWPPAGAEPIDVEALYRELSDLGMGYGPAFRLARNAWSSGHEIFAEISLEEGQIEDGARCTLHPALLDAALHPGLGAGEKDAVRLPFSWREVSVPKPGACSLRVRIAPTAEDTMRITAIDEGGAPVVSVAAVTGRPVDTAVLRQAGAAAEKSLFRIEWKEVPFEPAADEASAVAVLGEIQLDGESPPRHRDLEALSEAIADGTSVPEAVLVDLSAGNSSPLAATVRTLELLQAWLADARLAETCLVLLTRNALTVQGDVAPALDQAALAGLLRSAQSEHPDRFLLLDLPAGQAQAPLATVRAALEVEEPQLALRADKLLAPRLVRVDAAQSADDAQRTESTESHGTVLITGGTGGLGALVAKHLAADDGVDRLLLVSRSGPSAPGAAELIAELAELGCEASAAACDVADRDQLKAVLASIDPAHPLTSVIHAAGVLEDGVIETITAAELERVMGPKLEGAVNLHELTAGEGVELVMFSSAAATIGNPGQGAYAAANAALDALAHLRRAQGLRGVSLAWGLWDQANGMGGELDGADARRIRRMGIATLTPDRGLELLDSARAHEHEALLLPVNLDLATLRAQARIGQLPAPLRELVPAPARDTGEQSGSLARRLAGLPQEQWDTVVFELVREQVAAVLGESSADRVEPERAFKDLGFDSLAAVELRNRLHRQTGVRLASTLVFDHPTTAAVAQFLRSRLDGSKAVAKARRSVSRSDEPIAIVAMSCRYPGGVSSPADLWELVAEGRDAISPFPADRGWDLERLFDPDPDHVGTSYAREGGFLDAAADFDAGFFGISPREALSIDPQQRLLLEGAWEACERAGIDPAELRGSDTGVFAGVMYQDYGVLAGASTMRDELEGNLTIGSAGSVASGRVAYTFGFEGPAMTIDTACSSSLVALHLACQALQRGECSLALAGGVTVLCSPTVFVDFSRQRGLSPDGRCKSFAGAADGVGWGEGMGLLLVERLSDARRNGHPVLALVRGSAVNQDGASNGMAAPNGPSQERVIRQALENAGLSPSDVHAVEGHGTGTTLGDPIEAQALLATYGQARGDGPLRLGSIKSNIGHTQAAAGVAGVIKMVMAMRNGSLPASLHVDHASPHVDWGSGEISLLSDPEPWIENGRPRRAGVSSFGVSGTNAHLILEQAPPLQDAPASSEPLPAPPTVALALSARSRGALRAQAQSLCDMLSADAELAPLDLAVSLLSSRPQLERRAVVLGGERERLAEALRSFAAGEPDAGVFEGAGAKGATAFMFTGQGAQRAGMGARLYELEPTFAAALDEVCAALDPHLERSLKELMFAPEDSPQAALLDRTEFAQAALFALEVALFRTLESFGVRPDFLIGHSIGELVAAHVAGVLTLSDACTLVAARGRLMGALPTGGAMLAIAASEAEVLESIGELSSELAVAAVNSPRAVVVSGAEEAIGQLEKKWDEREVKRLRVSHAFHSPQMDAMLEQFEAVASTLSFSPPRIAIVSNLTGELIGAEIASAGHWVRHVRETVRFADGVAALDAAGATRFVELGPDGVLVGLVDQCLHPEARDRATLAPAMRARRDEGETLIGCLAQAHVNGVGVDWAALYEGRGGRSVELPTYPFERRRYWPEQQVGERFETSAHPLLGEKLRVAGRDEWLFSAHLSLSRQPWLADHAVVSNRLAPGTLFVELAFAAGRSIGCEVLDELTLEAPLIVPDRGALQLQLQIGEPDLEGRREISIHSRGESVDSGQVPEGQQWVRHAGGVIGSEVSLGEQDTPGSSWPPEGAEPLDIDYLYDRLAEVGFEYGPAFRGARMAWRRGQEVFAEVALDTASMHGSERFEIHPALLDSALHALVGEQGSSDPERLALPFAWTALRLHRRGASSLRVRLTPTGEDTLALAAWDERGATVITAEQLRARPVDLSQLTKVGRSATHELFELGWVELAGSGAEEMPYRIAALGELAVGEQIEHHPSPEALLASIDAGAQAPEVVLFAAPAEAAGADLGQLARTNVKRALELLKQWIAEDRLAHSRLALLTRGAVAAREGEAPDLAAAALWGLLRSAQSEHPDRFLLIDTDGREAEIQWAALLASDEPQLAIRDGRLYVPRLVPVSELTPRVDVESSLAGGGTVLITGGTGGLGAVLARHLARDRGVTRLALLSRRGPDSPGAEQLVGELAELGCTARAVACDITRREDLAAAIDEIPAEHPLAGVIHAAGVLADATIGSLTDEQIDLVMRPKLEGALHLHELTAGMELSAFVLFSSASATIGSPGQGNYAAANAFLDALAHSRRAQGLAGLSLGWGLWRDAGGMGGTLGEQDIAQLRSMGIVPLETEQGLRLFDATLEGSLASALPVLLDIDALQARARMWDLPAPLRGLVRTAARASDGEGTLAKQLSGVAEEERDTLTLELVCRDVAAVLGYDPGEEIDPDRSFKDLGMDSLGAIELRNRLSHLLGRRIPATLVFDHPTAAEVASFLRSRIGEVAPLRAEIDVELDTLERLLATIDEQAEREKIGARLRRLLRSTLDGSEEAAPEAIESASAEEIFELLDRELAP